MSGKKVHIIVDYTINSAIENRRKRFMFRRNGFVFLGTAKVRHAQKDFMNHIAVRMYKDKFLSLSEIAREYGITPHVLWSLFSDEGVDLHALRYDGVEF